MNNGGFPPIIKNNRIEIDKISESEILNLIKININKQKNKKNRKYLLLSSVGPNSLHISNNWYYEDRNYDLFLVFYDKEYYNNQSDYSIHMKGYKMEHYYFIFQLDLLNQYDYVFILDNDNKISGIDITKLFLLSSKLNANLLAPSIKIPNIDSEKVQLLVDYYYSNYKKLKGRFWGIEKYLPKNLRKIYNHVTKYTFWIHMIQSNKKSKYIKCTNIIEDGRYIININLIKKFRSDKNLMKLFKSGILFDQLLAHLSNLERIFIIDFISYQHMEPYKNKEKEWTEKKKILEYINSKKITNSKFYEIKPQYVEIIKYKLKKFNRNSICLFKKYY